MTDEAKPFRVEIIGEEHPHRHERGVCDPTKLVAGGTMALVTLDGPEGYACYAEASELRRLPTDD